MIHLELPDSEIRGVKEAQGQFSGKTLLLVNNVGQPGVLAPCVNGFRIMSPTMGPSRSMTSPSLAALIGVIRSTLHRPMGRLA
jgi:hypothetical protein